MDQQLLAAVRTGLKLDFVLQRLDILKKLNGSTQLMYC